MVKIVAQTELGFDQDGTTPIYTFVFRLTEPVNGVSNGGGVLPVGTLTESEANAIIQQRCADNANIDIGSVVFTSADVIGGRI